MKTSMSKVLPNTSACMVQKLAGSLPLISWAVTTDEANATAHPIKK